MLLGLYGIALLALAAVLVWLAVERWWHYLVIAVAWMPLFPLVATYITGDISPYLPAGAFPGNNKDLFIWLSIYATIMIAIMFAAVGFLVVKIAWQRVNRTR